jgi:hypothetical protein
VVTFILCVVAPFDHRYPVAALDVKVMLPPAQKVVGPPAVIVGVTGKSFTVITVAADIALWHPLALVTLTV